MTKHKNVGVWLNERYPNSDVFASAIHKIVKLRPSDTVAPSVVSVAPTCTVNELFVSLDQLDFSQNAKHGCHLIVTLFL